MYVISKDFAWSASHRLVGLPDEHPCSRLHGHNYVARVELEAHHLDETGFVLDYGELGFLREHIDTQLDHRHLNDVLSFNPTAENLAAYLADVVRDRLNRLALEGARRGMRVAVAVSETPKTWATYRETPPWRP